METWNHEKSDPIADIKCAMKIIRDDVGYQAPSIGELRLRFWESYCRKREWPISFLKLTGEQLTEIVTHRDFINPFHNIRAEGG